MLDHPLLLGTTNPHKLREFRELVAGFPILVTSAGELGVKLPGVDENGASAAENARLKATRIAEQLGRWTLADDTVLEVDALGGRPGVRTARYAGPAASMQQNRERLLRELEAVAAEHRSARFVCCLCVADASGRVRYEASGDCRGEILKAARGAGFGYDSLFFLPELGKTMAELDDSERRSATHRAKAMVQLAERMGLAC